MRKMKNLRDSAIQDAASMPKDVDEKMAFCEFAKMAKFLDDNFSPVEAVPQTAPMPISTDRYVWHACSADSMF